MWIPTTPHLPPGLDQSGARNKISLRMSLSAPHRQAGSVFGAESLAGIEPLVTIPVDRQTRIGSGSLSPSCGRRNEPGKEFIQLLLFGSSAGLSAQTERDVASKELPFLELHKPI